MEEKNVDGNNVKVLREQMQIRGEMKLNWRKKGKKIKLSRRSPSQMKRAYARKSTKFASFHCNLSKGENKIKFDKVCEQEKSNFSK